MPMRTGTEAWWTVLVAKPKMKRKLRVNAEYDQSVPLAPQAVETLRAIRWLAWRDQYVFPNSLSGLKSMSKNAIGYLYPWEGYQGKHVPHGWRSSFSIIMNELAERELSQDGRSEAEFIDNRARYMARRIEIPRIWTDMIMQGAVPSSEIINNPRCKQRNYSCRLLTFTRSIARFLIPLGKIHHRFLFVLEKFVRPFTIN